MDGQEIQQAEAAGGNHELERLISEAGMITAEAQATTPEALQAAQEAEQAVQLADQNTNAFRMILGMATGVFAMVGYPSVAAVLDEGKREALALAWGPLATKYGYDLSNMGSEYREEIGALFVTAPIAMAVWKGIKEDAAAREAAKPKPAQVTGTGAPAAGLKPGDPHYKEPEAAAA